MSQGTILPVVEEGEPCMQKDAENLAVEALFVEADFYQVIGSDFPFLQVDGQCHILNPSHAPNFFTLPTDIRR